MHTYCIMSVGILPACRPAAAAASIYGGHTTLCCSLRARVIYPTYSSEKMMMHAGGHVPANPMRVISPGILGSVLCCRIQRAELSTLKNNWLL
ncbi:hypothetical protein F4777DRAFT_24810 [Nemania sp. FL0916]|nr:hypothetical protein F4777DRAFT_24810 [Nemania sp. FL0916]